MKKKKTLQYYLSHILKNEPCLCCQQSTLQYSICEQCTAHLPWIEHHCLQCALPLNELSVQQCGQCIKKSPYFDASTTCFIYDTPIDAMIRGFKFNQQYHLARLFAYCLKIKLNNPAFDAIIPIPLHYKRHISRGFNQATWIAKHLSGHLNIPLKTNILKRTQDTSSQRQLDRSSRRQNIKYAFTAKMVPKHILLIDDVVTTTATVNAASLALKKSGAVYIEVASVARTAA